MISVELFLDLYKACSQVVVDSVAPSALDSNAGLAESSSGVLAGVAF